MTAALSIDAESRLSHTGESGSRNEPFVSIVIPCFNHGHFLPEAIESALGQTWPLTEIIVVDNGSTDDTALVAARYPTVQYVWLENRGLAAAARNAGVRTANGTHLLFLDADDRLLPTAVERAVACLERYPESALVYGNHVRTDALGTPLDTIKSSALAGEPYAALLERNAIGMMAAIVFRRDIFEKVGGFDETLKHSEDYDLYLRIAREHPISHFNEVMAEYRQHTGTLSTNYVQMLKTTLAVQQRQQSIVQGSSHLQALLRSGQRNARAYFGWKITQSLKKSLRQHRWRDATRDARELLQHCPGYVFQRAAEHGRTTLKRLPPPPLMRLLHRRGLIAAWPPVGRVRFGDLYRTTPLRRRSDLERGKPVDRMYIERFLASCAPDIKGRTLEIGTNDYTLAFGGTQVSQSDVLHARADNPKATFAGDLTNAQHLPSAAFDCVILTQTLHMIWDYRAALDTVRRILKPGGVLLLTVPGVTTQTDPVETRYWAFTHHAIRQLLQECFPEAETSIEVYGNVLTTSALLHGLAASEIPPRDYEPKDPSCPLIVAAHVRVPMETR